MRLNCCIRCLIGLILTFGAQAEVRVIKNGERSHMADVRSSWNGTGWNAIGSQKSNGLASAGILGGGNASLSRYVMKFVYSASDFKTGAVAQATLRMFVDEVRSGSKVVLEVCASATASPGEVEIGDFESSEYTLIRTVSVAEPGWIEVDVTDSVAADLATNRQTIVSAFRIQVQHDLQLPDKPLRRVLFVDNDADEKVPELVITTTFPRPTPGSVLTVGLLF